MWGLVLWLVVASCQHSDELVIDNPPTPPTPVPRPPPVEWPIRHQPCTTGVSVEQCLLDRYYGQWVRLQGEDHPFAGAPDDAFADLVVWVTLFPDRNITHQIASADCDRLTNDMIDIGVEYRKRPQKDCFFACFGSTADSDKLACVEREHCVARPEIDAEWGLHRLRPQAVCRELARGKSMPLASSTSPVEMTACHPREVCTAYYRAMGERDPAASCGKRPLTGQCKLTRW